MALLPRRRRPDFVASGVAGLLLACAVVWPAGSAHYLVLLALSLLAFAATVHFVPTVRDLFVAAGLCGIDLNKPPAEPQLKV